MFPCINYWFFSVACFMSVLFFGQISSAFFLYTALFHWASFGGLGKWCNHERSIVTLYYKLSISATATDKTRTVGKKTVNMSQTCRCSFMFVSQCALASARRHMFLEYLGFPNFIHIQYHPGASSTNSVVLKYVCFEIIDMKYIKIIMWWRALATG